MKRFYCTICRKLKRVRNYPKNVTRANAEQPEERIGTCSKHERVGYAKAHDIEPVELNMLNRSKRRA